MSERPIRTFVAVGPGVDVKRVSAVVPQGPEVDVVALIPTLTESWQALQGTQSDLLLVCTQDSEESVSFVRAAVAERPGRPVVALFDGSPNGFVGRLFEAGADDLVTIPMDQASDTAVVRSARERAVSHEVLFALQKAMARRQTAGGGKSTEHARMITVLGPKGGVGKTLTTASLAVSLAATGRRVVVVDLDLQFGDVGLSLGLAPGKTIDQLASSGGSLDADKAEDYLVTHEPSGAKVLLAPTRPDHASLVVVEFLRELYEVLTSSFEYVIVDTPPGFTPEVITSIDVSTDVCMIGMLDSLSLKNTKLGLETLELMGYDPENVRLVLNRADSRVGITRDDVHAIVGRPPDVLVPSHRDIPRSVNQGVPLVLSDPKSEASRSFRQLASLYDPEFESRHKGTRRRGRRRRREKI
jgi:Flp pilus assembly CpaE family ATPase